jgi:hypothetical protein
MLFGMFVSVTTEGMVCLRSWSGGTHPIMLSSSGNPGPDQQQVVYVLQYPGSHTGFPQEGSVSTHVQRKESLKFHGEAKGAETGCGIWVACTCENSCI